VSVTGVVPMGEHAVLVTCSDLAATHRLDAALRADRPAFVLDVVPGWDSVLVRCAPGSGAELDELAAALPGMALPDHEAVERAVVELPVTYDGPDLADVARLTGLDVGEVVARHTAPTYTVAFLGFTPGFPYLVGLDPALRVPRLDTPRQQVPAGSVGIAGEQTGVYPRATPGGWRIIGRTERTLFDERRAPPALLAPGDGLRFVAR
jgi:KipI family sensor histidine kinase inhibitor